MEGLLQVLLGGLLALGGAFIGPHFQRKHEKWRAEREDKTILRDKAELLFDELDRIASGSQLATMSVLKSINREATEVVPVPDLGKVRAIATVYFPTSQPLIDAYETKAMWASSSVFKTLEEKSAGGGIEPDEMKVLQVALVTEGQKNIAEFVRSMRATVSEVVPRIEQ